MVSDVCSSCEIFKSKHWNQRFFVKSSFLWHYFAQFHVFNKFDLTKTKYSRSISGIFCILPNSETLIDFWITFSRVLNKILNWIFQINIELNNLIEWIAGVERWMNNRIEWIFEIRYWIVYWIESFLGPIQRLIESSKSIGHP